MSALDEFGPPMTKKHGSFYDIHVNQLSDLNPGVRLIDVREAVEFDGDLGHLERAELVPLGELGAVSQAWKKDVPLLMICRSGNRSGQAAKFLLNAGFSHVANLVGGMLAVRQNEGKN